MIFIVLPAYNEQGAIRSLLERIDLTLKEHHCDYRVLIINDGSTDDTVRVVEGLKGSIPLEIISHLKNRGLGEAIKTGLMHATKLAQDHDVIITMDADNTHVPGLMMRLNRNIWEGCEVVIASRYVPGAKIFGVPWRRQFLAGCVSLLFRLFLPVKGVRDYTCGYRAYSADILKRAFEHYGPEFVSEPGFSCQIDILLKLARFQPVISEVPILLQYDRRGTDSKMKVGQTIRDTLRLFCRRVCRR